MRARGFVTIGLVVLATIAASSRSVGPIGGAAPTGGAPPSSASMTTPSTALSNESAASATPDGDDSGAL